jgi:hypothetical protein
MRARADPDPTRHPDGLFSRCADPRRALAKKEVLNTAAFEPTPGKFARAAKAWRDINWLA